MSNTINNTIKNKSIKTNDINLFQLYYYKELLEFTQVMKSDLRYSPIFKNLSCDDFIEYIENMFDSELLESKVGNRIGI